MGQNFSSEPVVEKDTERDHNDIFNVAVSSCQGWRMSQEDNHSMMLSLPGEHKAAFFAVYDGHGSARVSKHASESLWQHLVGNESYIKGNFKEALAEAFLTFDREVNDSYNAQLAGTTAICLLVVNNVVYCANIGDSRAVASINCKSVPLSYDHKPENPQELKRILAAGGYVLGNRVNGNLALSRAFGDFHYKGNEQLPPEQQIVSPCPDIKTIDLEDDVDFLLLACDGIWDVLSNEEVVEFVISRLEQQMEPGLICEQLTTRCLATDYELVIGCDNMTVLLVCYTRGRSWTDFCTDIFNKNSSRLGVPRTPPRYDGESLINSVPQSDQEQPQSIQQKSESQEVSKDINAPNNVEAKCGSEQSDELSKPVSNDNEGTQASSCSITSKDKAESKDDNDDGQITTHQHAPKDDENLNGEDRQPAEHSKECQRDIRENRDRPQQEVAPEEEHELEEEQKRMQNQDQSSQQDSEGEKKEETSGT